MTLLLRFAIGVLMGFLYVYLFTHLLAPIRLEVKGKRLHHNFFGALMAIFVFVPLVFFFYMLNFDLLNNNEAAKLGVSILGLAIGTIIEHKLLHSKK
jgi:hypothetical protein